jgi:hypothetical protein
MMALANSLSPTFFGHVATVYEAHLLVECCLRGLLKPLPRRPDRKAFAELIRSGNVFIYEEESAEITRWTDGKKWGRGRNDKGFIVYCEREPVSATEKDLVPTSASFAERMNQRLRKKSISVTLTRSLPRPSRYHIVSYYSEDVGALITPSKHPSFQNIILRPELTIWTSTKPAHTSASNHYIPAMTNAISSTYVPDNGSLDCDGIPRQYQAHQQHNTGGWLSHDTRHHHGHVQPVARGYGTWGWLFHDTQSFYPHAHQVQIEETRPGEQSVHNSQQHCQSGGQHQINCLAKALP